MQKEQLGWKSRRAMYHNTGERISGEKELSTQPVRARVKADRSRGRATDLVTAMSPVTFANQRQGGAENCV